MKAKKVHLRKPGTDRRAPSTRCGWASYVAAPDMQMLDREQFVWLPAGSQCHVCLNCDIDLRLEVTFGRPVSATPEMLIVVESIIVSLERLDAAARLVPHKERGCYHRFDSQDPDDYGTCWCGEASLLNVPLTTYLTRCIMDEAIANRLEVWQDQPRSTFHQPSSWELMR